MMKMQKWRGRIFAGLCGLLWGGIVGSAQAGDCVYGTGQDYTTGQAVYEFTVPATISLTGTEAPGTVLWESPAVAGSKATWANCGTGAGSAGLKDNWGTSASPVGSFNAIKTNVAGIGYVISQGNFVNGIKAYPSNPDGPGPNNNHNTHMATLKFVKLSTAYFSGTSAALAVVSDIATWYVGTNEVRFANYRANATTFTKPGGGNTTCILRNVPVNLGSAKASIFRSIGAKGPVVSDFFTSVDITCPSTTSTAKLTFSSTTAVAASPGVLRASGGSTVQGIGIILMRDDGVSPIRFGQQFPVDLAAVGSNKVGNFPFSAAMIKISDPVVPGALSGTVVVTLSVT
ncbi:MULTISPECIES: fimbrial protein [unclassified Herbaspirillum]|uniref:fimbrial protein n=1 Tax=unclassified Herbaspirillum TaxID=2624150 RepID=UPI00383AF102